MLFTWKIFENGLGMLNASSHTYIRSSYNTIQQPWDISRPFVYGNIIYNHAYMNTTGQYQIYLKSNLVYSKSPFAYCIHDISIRCWETAGRHGMQNQQFIRSSSVTSFRKGVIVLKNTLFLVSVGFTLTRLKKQVPSLLGKNKISEESGRNSTRK